MSRSNSHTEKTKRRLERLLTKSGRGKPVMRPAIVKDIKQNKYFMAKLP